MSVVVASLLHLEGEGSSEEYGFEEHVDPSHGDRVVVAGRTVARRRTRDGTVELAPNVVVVKGAFEPGGGSVRRPEIGCSDDPAVLEVRDMPRSALTALDDGTYETVDDDPTAALRRERERLVERVAEIDRLLGKAQ